MRFEVVAVLLQMAILTAFLYMTMDMNWFCRLTVAMVAAKAMVIGSELNFDLLRKHGQRYWNWYLNRKEFT